VFGVPTDVDRKALAKLGLKVLPKAEVFRGGYDEPEPESAAEEAP
jgi:hypothetical protein